MSEKSRPLSKSAVVSFEDNRDKKSLLSSVFSKASKDSESKKSKFKETVSQWFGDMGAGFVAFRNAYKARVDERKLSANIADLESRGYVVAQKGTIDEIVNNLDAKAHNKKTKSIAELKKDLVDAFSHGVESAKMEDKLPEPVSKEGKEVVAEAKAKTVEAKKSFGEKAKGFFAAPFMNLYATIMAKREADKIAKYQAQMQEAAAYLTEKGVEVSIPGKTAEPVAAETKVETKADANTEAKPVEAVAPTANTEENKKSEDESTKVVAKKTKKTPSSVKKDCEAASLTGVHNEFESVLQLLENQRGVPAESRDYRAIADLLAKTSANISASLDSTKSTETSEVKTPAKKTEASAKAKTKKVPTKTKESKQARGSEFDMSQVSQEIEEELPFGMM